MDHPRDTEPGLASGGTLGPSGEEAPRPRMSPATIAAKVGTSSPGSLARVPLHSQVSARRPSSWSQGQLRPPGWSHPESDPRGGSGDPGLSLQSYRPQHGEEVSPAASDLAMVLTRGLSLEHQKSSRDSLQYSSGYSTQTTTPSCSEDTIPSQGRPQGWGWDTGPSQSQAPAHGIPCPQAPTTTATR